MGVVLVSSPKLPQFCRRLLLHRCSHFFAESAYFPSAFFCRSLTFNPGVDAMWVEFVVGSLVYSEYSSFPSPQKPTFSNSNSTRNQVDEEPISGCTTSKSLFICISFLAVVASGMVVVCKQCKNSQQSWDLQ